MKNAAEPNGHNVEEERAAAHPKGIPAYDVFDLKIDGDRILGMGP